MMRDKEEEESFGRHPEFRVYIKTLNSHTQRKKLDFLAHPPLFRRQKRKNVVWTPMMMKRKRRDDDDDDDDDEGGKTRRRRRRREEKECNKNTTGCVTSVVRVSVPVHPSKLANRKKGVREQLDAKTLRHHDGFGGVLVKYEELNIVNEDGMNGGETILPASSYVNVKAMVKATVFAPKMRSYLIGKVNKIGQDHIGLVVGNIFNASIPIEKFKENMMFDESKNAWEIIEDGTENNDGDEEESDESSSMSMKEIKVGSRVKFRVEKVNREDDRVVLLVGSLLGKGCGPVDSSRQGDDDEETINGTDAAAEDDADEEEAKRDKRRKKKEKKEKKEKEEKKEKKAKKEKKEKKEKKAKKAKKEFSPSSSE